VNALTISTAERQNNCRSALLKMMSLLGDNWVRAVKFDVLDTKFGDIFRTTWKELEREGLIAESISTMGGHICYRLTGAGWIEGLRLTAKLDSQELREQMIGLRAELKKQVKGRERDAAVLLHQFAEETRIAEGWIWNVVDSRLLSRFFPDDMVDVDWWDNDHRAWLMRIPIDIGMKRLR
jgi:hypothetical protein